jgi:protein DJ-1
MLAFGFLYNLFSRGPGSTFAFALTLVELLVGEEKRKEITPPMMFPPGTPWSR